MSDVILGPVIATVDAVGRGQWDWWIVAVMVLVVAGVNVWGVLTRGPLHDDEQDAATTTTTRRRQSEQRHD